MRTSRLPSVLALAIVGALVSTAAFADPNPTCHGLNIANGPFTYDPSDLGSKTFVGGGGASASASVTVKAPGSAGDDVFPAQSNGPCAETALADIAIIDIEKIADESGVLLDPWVAVDLGSPLGLQIAAAFFITPASHLFTIADAVEVDVTINNPGVAPADYGDYEVVIKAKATGSGIGVGSGTRFLLKLRAPALTDNVPPDVTIVAPATDQILGPVAVTVTAADPAPGSGVNTLSASISSAGNTVSNQPIALALDQTLPVPAGVLVTGTGSFTPTGGTGPAGTLSGAAFTAASRSGIGSYTLNASATDVGGNVGGASKTFAIAYDVAFTTASASTQCANAGSTSNCTGRFEFTVKRSSITSDGAFMVDQTVKVALETGGAVVVSHTYGTGQGGVLSFVQIESDASSVLYKTHFKRSDIAGASGPRTYVAKVYFRDVDNNWMLQATSAPVTF